MESSATLWDGHLQNPEILVAWQHMTDSWMGAMAIGATGALYIIQTLDNQSREPVCIKLPMSHVSIQSMCLCFDLPSQSLSIQNDTEIKCLSWALVYGLPLEPLVVFACAGLIYTVNVVKQTIVNCLHGHGGVSCCRFSIWLQNF